MGSYEKYSAFERAVKRINEAVLKPDLLKDPAGKNFRAISESKILEALNPIFASEGIDYNIEVIEQDLKWITDAAGKISFLATCKVRLSFFTIDSSGETICFVEAPGMGIDPGDKAIGKAYTYAVKYALLKKFRLLYSDDPDASVSTTITGKDIGKPKEEKPKTSEEKSHKSKKEPMITEKMSDYLKGLAKELELDNDAFFGEFGFYPDSKEVKQADARKAIEVLKKRVDEQDELPF